MKEFEKDVIKKALDDAIKDVMRNDEKLLRDKCSERAVAHWLANYFLQHIQEALKSKGISFNNQGEYTVDVEYNRIGKGVNPKVVRQGRVMLDIVFHRRSDGDLSGQSSSEDNILCIEVKATRTKSTTKRGRESLLKDKNRISALVSEKHDIEGQPRYMFGAAVHFESDGYTYVCFYEGDNKCSYTIPKKDNTEIGHPFLW